MSSTSTFSILIVFLVVVANFKCESTSVVTCMLCKVITEPLEYNLSPTATLSAMFKKCDKMGLMEPVCGQFVSENVKTIFNRVKSGVPPQTICQAMQMCEPTTCNLLLDPIPSRVANRDALKSVPVAISVEVVNTVPPHAYLTPGFIPIFFSISLPSLLLFYSYSPPFPIIFTFSQSMANNLNEIQSSSSTSSTSKNIAKTLRLYSSDGERSTRMEVDENTMCADICQHFSCDVITLQIGNYHFRQLKPSTSPLAILHDFCRILSMSEDESSRTFDEILTYTDSSSFRHIFSFFLGRPRIRAKSTLNSGILSEDVLIRKGKILHSWVNAKAVFYNSNIRLQMKQNHDDLLNLRKMRADIHDSKRGKSLRLRNDDQCYLLIFQRPNILQVWLTKAQQIEKSTHIDMSDEHLTMIPEQLLTSTDAPIQVLNLRRNSLISRPPLEKNLALGYVDDLYRMSTLQVIDLSANQIQNFPIPLTVLGNLRQLNLSSNYIQNLPREIGNLQRLQLLNLSNNMLTTLPNELVNCTYLSNLDLSFNQFSDVPNCLYQMNILDMFRLAGNNIEKIGRVGSLPSEKIDLRRNILSTSFRLDVENITHLDIRDNSLVSTVHLTNLRFLKIIHCERLQLTSLHLSGDSLTHVYADNNLLESIVIMPLPLNLQTLSLSFNHFKTLPNWICDCPMLTFLRVNDNRLEELPRRIFCSQSLRCIFAFNNQLTQLPDDFDEVAQLETLILYKNQISELPRRFFSGILPRLRQLNLSSNQLEILPYFDASSYCRIQIFRAANNLLTETSVPVIINMKHLKTLDLSHNFLNSFDDSALTSLDLLEEINLSSNRLTRLPDCLALLPALQILRAHSNQLVYIPQLQNCLQLHTIDISSNNISLGTLDFQTPPNLRHFDVTCNSGDFLANNSTEKMNMIDIAEDNQNLFGFQIGMSGSRGSKNKQCIRQMRVANTFAFIDGGSNYFMSTSISRFLSQYLREHPNVDIRSVLLRAHCELGEDGERLGASVMIVRVSERFLEVTAIGTISAAISMNGNVKQIIRGRYEIDDDEYSRIREAHGFVDEENKINGIIQASRQIGHYSMFPIVLPTHSYKKIALTETLDGLIVANNSVWSMVPLDDVAQTFHMNRSPIVIAKKLQDKLQSFDYGGNSNILVLRKMKPQVTFTQNSTLAKRSDILHPAIPALIIPTPAIRHAPKHSPSPPPLPDSNPPPFISESLDFVAISSSKTGKNDEYYSTIKTKRQFDERRQILSRNLKLSPPD
ncbi:unnamed protein product [Caenorhabditis angaria]|uniref:PPM-type phosphatase domain-containing protein n=1 Tax=Caenorhabditis angaria TaxID=860376 RepID=A0A9P1INV8_9PELO|nr:unnamed protein product [Caenorhabditis angaria]